MSTSVTLSATDQRDTFARGVSLASAIDLPCVLNTDAMAAAADATDIATILASGSACKEMPVPAGASYLKACLIYVGTAPTTAAAVRCFGRISLRPQYSATLLPASVHASYGDWTLDKGASNGLWVPRGNDALGVLVQTLPTTVAMFKGTGLYCEPVVFHVGGCDRVVVPVSTAAVGPTRALVFGWFEQ